LQLINTPHGLFKAVFDLSYLTVLYSGYYLVIIVGFLHATFRLKNELTACLMKIINEKHKNSYPYITINNSEIKGKIEYLFDKNSIILNENGIIKAIYWDSIKCLEIQVNKK